MTKTASRLLMALLVSSIGFASTWAWYKTTEQKQTENSNQKKIARLTTTVNDVRKKGAQNIIWQPAENNEVLHAGEAIRTSTNSEARIEFLDSHIAIDLEPDSAIVLEESNGQNAINFLEGNIFVKSDGDSSSLGANVALKTGEKTVALGASEVSVGKSRNGELNVDVFKGSVKGLSENVAKIQILAPLPSAPIYLDPSGQDSAPIKWSPLSPEYVVYVEVGASRSSLKPLNDSSATGDTGTLSARLPLGKNYFRLTAKSSNPQLPPLSSPIIRLNCLAKIAPTILTPENLFVANLDRENANMKILWSNPSGFNRIILEIATTANLRNKVITERLENETEYNFSPPKSGLYYLRISGVLNNGKEVISSTISRVKVNLLDKLQAPLLDLPKDNERISSEKINDGLTLSWKAVPAANRYKVAVQAVAIQDGRGLAATENVFEKEGKFLNAIVKNLTPGNYSWTVTAIGSSEDITAVSEKRYFNIQKLSQLNWADGQTTEDFYYLTLRPSLTLKWEKGDPHAVHWQVRITSDEAEAKPILKKTAINGLDIELPTDGHYTAEVEAYDNSGSLLAQSVPRQISVAPAPLLPAPKFASSLPKDIEATGQGAVTLQWQEVDGAQKYILSLKSEDGRTTRQYDFNSRDGHIKGLMPGQYKISLRSVDKGGRLGPYGEERALTVPNRSDLRAPKLKGMQVK